MQLVIALIVSEPIVRFGASSRALARSAYPSVPKCALINHLLLMLGHLVLQHLYLSLMSLFGVDKFLELGLASEQFLFALSMRLSQLVDVLSLSL